MSVETILPVSGPTSSEGLPGMRNARDESPPGRGAAERLRVR
jgi:hypothetical protein